MKKFTLLLMAAACFATSFAQAPALKGTIGKTATLPQMLPVQGQKATLRPVGSVVNNVEAAERISPYYNTLIENQPAGTLVKAQKSGVYYYLTWFGIYTLRSDGQDGDYVLQQNGNIYLKKGINGVESGWLRLDKVDDTTYVCHTPQKIYREEYNGSTSYYYAIRMTLNSDSTSYVVEKDSANKNILDVEFSFKDGVLQQKRQDPGEILGLGNLSGRWVSYGDYAITATPLTEEKAVVPDGAEKEDFVFRCMNADSTTSMGMVKVAFDGDDVYVCNPYNGDTTTWIKGTVYGDEVRFPSNQYLGTTEYSIFTVHTFFMPASYTIEIDENGAKAFNPTFDVDTLVMDFDRDTRTITSLSGNCWAINAGNQHVYTIGVYGDPVIYPFREVAAVPADPVLGTYSAYNPQYGYGYIQVTIPSHSVDGEYLNTNKLFYNFYVNTDEEPETLYKDDYKNALYDELTDIPYGYTDGDDIFSSGDTKGFYFYVAEFDSIGFRSFYTGGDETHYSHIVWYNPNPTTDAIQGVGTTGKAVSSVAWYDLGGRRIAAPRQKGAFIREVTYADGSRKTQKMLKR